MIVLLGPLVSAIVMFEIVFGLLNQVEHSNLQIPEPLDTWLRGRDSHFPSPFHDIIKGVTISSNFGVDTFANDDRIIDDDTQNENKTEQADHIDRDRPWANRHQP